MKHTMFNNNILTKEVIDDTTESDFGFVDKKQTKYKKLEIQISSDETLKQGDIVKVKKLAGDKIELPDGDYTIINITDVILKL